jgi:hypothetical protein
MLNFEQIRNLRDQLFSGDESLVEISISMIQGFDYSFIKGFPFYMALEAVLYFDSELKNLSTEYRTLEHQKMKLIHESTQNPQLQKVFMISLETVERFGQTHNVKDSMIKGIIAKMGETFESCFLWNLRKTNNEDKQDITGTDFPF